MGKLAGKIALVTGASKGIGRGIALAFAREGADLLLSARGEESLANTAKEVAALGVRVEVQAGDVGSEEDVNAMFAHWQQSFDRLDLLVNNAGAFNGGPLDELATEDWDHVINTNLEQAIFTCQ